MATQRPPRKIGRRTTTFSAKATKPERAKFLTTLDASLQNLKNSDEFVTHSSPATGTRLKEIHVPTEILVGEADIADVHAQAGTIEEGIVGSQRDVVINAGDLVQLEQPDIVMEKLTNFVDRQERVAVDVPVDVLQSYVGTYTARDRGLTVMLDGNHLMAQAPGQASAQLFAESRTKFFFRTADVEVEFTKDSAGQAARRHLSGRRDDQSRPNVAPAVHAKKSFRLVCLL